MRVSPSLGFVFLPWAWGCAATMEDGAGSADTGASFAACAPDPGGSTVLAPAGLGPAWDAQTLGTEDVPSGWGASVADFDGDGRLDVFLPQPGQDELYLQQADGTLADARDRLPVEDERGIGSAAADYDGDGDMDLVVLAADDGGSLLLNKMGVFHDVTYPAGIDRWQLQGYSAAFADADGDEDLDLVVARLGGEFVAEGEDPPTYYNALFENRGDGTFTDRSDRLSGDGQAEFTFLTAWLDVESDGDQDLFFVNDKGHVGLGNALLTNAGDGTFVDATAGTGLDMPMTGAMGLGIGDLNGDLLPDLLVTDWGRLWYFESHGPLSWYDASVARGIVNDADAGQLVSWGAELEDLDADGRVDAVIAYGTDEIVTVDGPPHGGTTPEDREPFSVLRQSADGQFAEVAPEWGMGAAEVNRGIVVADLDGDGLLDVVRRDVWGRATASVQTGGGGGWLVVALEQPGPNRFAIGARVDVEVGGVWQTRWIRAGGTSLSSSGPPEAHFGIGFAAEVDRVRVTWPDGGTDEWTGVAGCTRAHLAR